MRPVQLKTRIFLDSGDPQETREALALLGFLDGQTLNPSLFAKSPEVADRMARGEKFTKDDIYTAYRKIADEVNSVIPEGDISIEVYADWNTSAEDMLAHARDMQHWVNHPHIKLPVIKEGLRAARMLTDENIPVNMTLCFSEEQAAAVYAATMGAAHEVFVSPFGGRLDDIGFEGVDLFADLMQLYANSDHHVKVLAASIRNLDSFKYALSLGIDIITAPLNVLKMWAEAGLAIPEAIPYKGMPLDRQWESYDIHADLTDKGLDKFVEAWNDLISA